MSIVETVGNVAHDPPDLESIVQTQEGILLFIHFAKIHYRLKI
jgi:hypothetical protein